MEFPDLQFGVRTADAGDGVYVVGVRGELDQFNAPELDLELRSLLARDAVRVIVDLAGVTFLDSTAIGVLARWGKALRKASGELVVATDSPHTRKVLEITGLDRMVAVRRTLGEALVEAEHRAWEVA
jgi:anti-sigma B factor antagonist